MPWLPLRPVLAPLMVTMGVAVTEQGLTTEQLAESGGYTAIVFVELFELYMLPLGSIAMSPIVPVIVATWEKLHGEVTMHVDGMAA
jgi:hypothetical protein